MFRDCSLLSAMPGVHAEDDSPASAPVACAKLPQRLVVLGCGAPERARAERFVRRAYHRCHGASVQSFMPLLLALQDDAARLLAVVGVRAATGATLYLERYLDEPIESAIAAATGASVERSAIAEIGNLAGRNLRAARRLIGLLPRQLLDAGYTWIAFTGTRSVRAILSRTGAPLHDLGAADAQRLGSVPDAWGRYFAADPRVTAGYLPCARELPQLWQASHGA